MECEVHRGGGDKKLLCSNVTGKHVTQVLELKVQFLYVMRADLYAEIEPIDRTQMLRALAQ